jgi:hypothetical protein
MAVERKGDWGYSGVGDPCRDLAGLCIGLYLVERHTIAFGGREEDDLGLVAFESRDAKT